VALTGILFERGKTVILLKTFFSKCTPQAIEYLDQHVNEWIQKHNAKVVHSAMTVHVVEGKGGQKEPNLFMNVWHEPSEPQQ
jgi:hypothetical protein